jgi:hypothetical protein
MVDLAMMFVSTGSYGVKVGGERKVERGVDDGKECAPMKASTLF